MLAVVPKRPPRVAASLPFRATFARKGPTRAHTDALGELWHADVSSCSASSTTGSVDLVVTDPPYAIDKAAWDEFESLEVYVDWCDRWLAEVARVLAPHGSAYVCGFSEILADVKARSARRFASCRWLVWYYRNKANLGRDWGRSHESILHLRGEATRVDVDAVRIPYNGHTTKYPARVQAVSSQYARARRARSVGAQPARRQAARRHRDPGDLQRHGGEDAARHAEARGADREADPRVERAGPARRRSVRRLGHHRGRRRAARPTLARRRRRRALRRTDPRAPRGSSARRRRVGVTASARAPSP